MFIPEVRYFGNISLFIFIFDSHWDKTNKKLSGKRLENKRLFKFIEFFIFLNSGAKSQNSEYIICQHITEAITVRYILTPEF